MGISPITTRREDFLNLPVEVQVLFFHLAVRANEDGIVFNPEAIADAVGYDAYDMRLLESEGFLKIYETCAKVIMKGDE